MHHPHDAPLYFWRTHGGQEVDFMIEFGGKMDAIEIKSGMSIRPAMISSLKNTISQWENGRVKS